jgi:pimeloyl-ACP methyl ester carboxylesterase
MAYVPTYHDLPLSTSFGEVSVHYIEAGDPSLPTMILYAGFPSSSTQYRNLVPLLSDSYHILGPDFPGFGLTTVPDNFVYTFDNLAAVTDAWLEALKLKSYAIYIFDYGAPVGLRLATKHPEQVKAIVSQNGNAYKAGFGEDFWAPIFNLWKSSNSREARDVLRDNVLTLGITKYQYEANLPAEDLKLIDPAATYHSDFKFNVQGKVNQEHQLDLFYDYRTNVDLYPKWQQYFRDSKVPLLAVWGKYDPAFIPPGAEAFKQDSPNAKIVLLDGTHFLLETKRWEVAKLIKEFLGGADF